MRWFAICALTISSLMGPASTAHAFGVLIQGNEPARWRSNRIPIRIAKQGAPGIANDSDIQALYAAADSWSGVGCTDLQFVQVLGSSEGGSLITTGTTDGVNLIHWVKDEPWEYGSRVLAVTIPMITGTGVIVEADIAFNGVDFRWTAGGESGIDIQSVAVHEFGHLLGLQHVLGGERLADPPSMAPKIDPSLGTRSLNGDDASGVCFLYPARAYQCERDCDCPVFVSIDGEGQEYNSGNMTCDRGLCTGLSAPQSSPLGAVCQAQAALVAPTDACLCDQTTLCDAACVCDLDCTSAPTCACDSTYSCDPDSRGDPCECDPECGGGCAALPGSTAGGVPWWILGMGLFPYFRRRLSKS